MLSFLLLMTVSTLASSDCTSHKSPLQTRAGSIQQYPSVLFVESPDKGGNFSFVCAAVILNRQWGLTTAHCFDEVEITKVVVRAGSSISNSGGFVHTVALIVMHEDYKKLIRAGYSYPSYDIAVFQVQPLFQLKKSVVELVNLPPQGVDVAIGSRAETVAWRKVLKEKKPYYTLQKQNVVVTDGKRCNSVFPNYNLVRDTICTDMHSNVTGFCHGGNGGPLFINRVLVGLTSWMKNCTNPLHPIVHVQVSAYRDWIDKQSKFKVPL